jgi:hypothetical protein
MDFEKAQCHYPPVPCLNSAMALFLALPDPEHSTLARLVLTSAYLVAAWLWWRSGARTKTVAESFIWRQGAILLFLLSVNKFFNLRLLFEDGMKAIAKSGNWYDSREPVQFVLAIVLPLLLAAIAMIFTLTKGKAFLGRRPAALAGWIFLLLYIALRQSQEWKPALASLEAIHYREWRMGLEVAGIGLLIGSALMNRRNSVPG